jgi:hypothetical protein
MKMYEKDVIYKFRLRISGKPVFYTGKVIEENSTHLKILTTRNEDIVINFNVLEQVWHNVESEK